MALKYLDLENKLYTPTQELMAKFQNEFMTLYNYLSEYLLEMHSIIVALGLEWYENPMVTTTKWYDTSVLYGNELYARVVEDIIPQMETKYDEVVVASTDFGTKTMDSINYVIENPEQVTSESIESVTATLTEAGNISTELVTELQDKTSEIVALLLDKPLETIENAYMDILTTLLNSYFELVSNILVSI